MGEEFQFTRDMDELFSVEEIFSGLESEYEQRAYYKKNLNLIVSFIAFISIFHFVMLLSHLYSFTTGPFDLILTLVFDFVSSK